MSRFYLVLIAGLFLTSCVSKKEFAAMQTRYQTDLEACNKDLGNAGVQINEYINKLAQCEQDKKVAISNLKLREEQISDLKEQIGDVRSQRDKTVEQVGDLTVLSQSANQNIGETLKQLEGKDKYIRLIQAAKTKADSINLALAVNLKTVLRDGIDDNDVDIKVDKTVVFINLSDKMLYTSGSYEITSRANEVLAKIAKIVQSRPNVEVMVEGYTDNIPISKVGVRDNWDLSVLRSASVVRALQTNFGVDPNRLIAAGRGEFNTLATNDTPEGRSMNRRTRIIILPKLNEFYDLLDPEKVPE